jgi:hypothetical protein
VIHATGFRPNERLTVKMTTYDGGVCVSNEPDPSCFWERQADSNGNYDRTTPLDVVTTPGKHWYWVEGAQSGATNRVVIDLTKNAPNPVDVAPTAAPRTASAPIPTVEAFADLVPADRRWPAAEEAAFLKGINSPTAPCILAESEIQFTLAQMLKINAEDAAQQKAAMYPIAFFCANTSGVFSTAPLPTISTAAPAGTILDVTGSGIKTTRSFTIGNAWDLIWSYDCSDFGTKGNFQVYVFKADGSLSRNAGVNELDNSGNGVEHFHQGGTLYLEMNSECTWHVVVQG